MTAFVATWPVPDRVNGVDDSELDLIRGLFDKWQRKLPRNVLRASYFDGKMLLKPTGNIPPESMARIEATLDWPEKAVTALAERSVFEGFVAPGGVQDPFELEAVLDANRFDLELPQAIESAYKSSCAFYSTTVGDVQSGEPEVLVIAREATWSSALWDESRRVVEAAMSVKRADGDGQPLELDVFLRDWVLTLVRRSSAWVVTDRRPNPLGEVLVEPLTYSPSLTRPFGRSRISRAVMNITDHALSTIVRTEISADFYAAPRMAALGVSEDAFARGKWQAAIDRWFAISRDENGDLPTVTQFPQMTMQPLVEQYRMYATQFSGATGVPVSNLGIVTDNPPSAEALYADDRRLVSTANRQNRILGSSLKRVAQKIVRLRDGGEVTDELRQLDVAWMNPSFTSPSTSADALVKLSAVFPWMAESEVALQFAGFTQAEITRLLADKQRYDSRAFAQALRTVEGAVEGEQPAGSEDELNNANVLKAKADALGVLRRAGVEANDAARLAGLSDVKFIPGQPITIKSSEE